MNRLPSPRSVAAVFLALGAFGAASVAQARSDVQFSISVGSPGFYVQPTPVYMQPDPVFVRSAPVFVRPTPIYVRPAPVAVQPVYGYGYSYRNGYKVKAKGPWGDDDRDGVANRYDRFPANPYRR